jgi:bacillithiol biosynthesis cysteine-adding enzyme BshC
MSSSSALDVDCLATGLVSGLARDLLVDRHRDLLSPLRFLSPGAQPTGAPPRVDRTALATALGTANAAWGHPGADELAAKLADPATRVVATGQQTGLFGGPLLGLVKAAAATRWAEALAADGAPAVAVFWMATEDHDWAEIAEASFPSRTGIRRMALGRDSQPLAPVGLRTVGAGVGPLIEELEALYATPWGRSAWRQLAGFWRPEARFGEAFARQMVATLGERAPLMLDSMLPELKRAERPHLLHLVTRRDELETAFSGREKQLGERGLDPQVAPQPGSSPLFLVRGAERRRIEWRGGERFALRGAAGEEPVSTLLATIEENPAAVSPGALARPAIQDAVLGTMLQVMGPGELGYMAQAAAVYPLLDLQAPWSSLRPSALVLERRQREKLEALGLDLQELLGDAAAAERRLGERLGGGFVAATRETVLAQVEALGEPARALDAGLERPHAKTRRTVERALERFATKVARAAARRDEATRERFDSVRSAVLPAGRQQERLVACAHFVARHGGDFGAALLDGLDLDPRRLSVIEPATTERSRR